MNEKKIALLELRRDPLFHIIPSNRYEYYIDNSINIGKKLAEQYKGVSIKRIYNEHHIEISYSENENMIKNFQLRAEFIQKENVNEVVLYKNTLIQLVNAWNEVFDPNDKLTYLDVENIHLAHEFLHYLEYTIESPVEKQLDPVKVKTIFGRKRSQYIRQSSEIASHSFAKEMLNLDYFPTLLDLVFLFFKEELDPEIAFDTFGYNTFKEKIKNEK